MFRNGILASIFGLCVWFTSHSAMAAPKVVVTVPELHSLVSALMQGVGEPDLLFERGWTRDTELDAFQASHMLTADMIIWSGAGYETPVAAMVKQFSPLEAKLMTLSNYLPLLSESRPDPANYDRQHDFDLRFWSDPKLAVMSVRMITPRLVRLDPDNSERYLDNEISLINKLKHLSTDIASLMRPYSLQPHAVLSGVDRYFAHRFLAGGYLIATRQADGLQKVSSDSAKGGECMAASASWHSSHIGPELYFESLRHKAEAVARCLHERDETFNSAQALSTQQAMLNG